ncbi:hypothetical protein JXA48_01440 [Candidatus Woesearchaeota archaeon]|nr:hypothetical protein [Candidatus Woesearchaeota archaeon]
MKRVILLILVTLTLILTACGTQEIYLCSDGSFGGGQVATSDNLVYFCPDGRQTTNYNSCTFEKQIVILQKDAETKALNFVNGHLRANGWQATLVNVNVVDGNWLAQVVVSKYDNPSFETVVKVDGLTGFATCDRNCDYLEE